MNATTTEPANGRAVLPKLGREYLTTGQVARLCGVAPRTVTKWCDGGRLEHYKIPGSNDRRVYRADLIDFLRRNKMRHQLAALESVGCVMCVGTPTGLIEGVRAELPAAVTVVSAPTMFAAGELFGRCRPTAVILSGTLGRVECLTIAAAMTDLDPRPVVICLVPEDHSRGPWLPDGLAVELPSHAGVVELARLVGAQ